MRKILAGILVFWGGIVGAVTPAFCAEPEYQRIYEAPADNDGTNFESESAELDSQPGERAPETLPEDDTPALDGVAVR